jgi:hypothetical protein
LYITHELNLNLLFSEEQQAKNRKRPTLALFSRTDVAILFPDRCACR